MKRKFEELDNNNSKLEENLPETKEVFADPTYDITFKMFFRNEKHKDVLIKILNKILHFNGDRLMTDEEIESSGLPISGLSDVTIAINSQPDEEKAIKKECDILNTENWTEDQKILHWKQQKNLEDMLSSIEDELEEARQEGLEIAKELRIKKDKILSEISQVKKFMKLNISEKDYINDLAFLNKQNIDYIAQHTDESDSKLMGDLGFES